MPETYDMVVIGGGPGGYVAALRGRQLGLSIALVEKEKVGGVCLNRGCIPTKALLADVEGLHWVRHAVKDGILDRVPRVDFARIAKRKAAVVKKVVSNLETLIVKSGVRLIHDVARIAEPRRVITDSGEVLRTPNIVIATGARSWAPPIPGADLPGVVSTRQILDWETAPEKLVIIGGGVIGQEFATIFSALGTSVTVLEALDRILTEVDAEIARRYAALLPGKGIGTETGVIVHGMERSGDELRVVYEKKGKERVVTSPWVLMATGRRPDFEGLGIEKLGMTVRGNAVEVNRFLSTSVDGISAIGDVIGRKMLAHAASYHGELVAENVAGIRKPLDDEIIPACVFTVPQIAWVGLTEEQARQRGRAFRTSAFAIAASGKAQALGESRGLFKLIEDTETGTLIGAHLFGPHVSELLGELTLAIRKGMSASDIADTIHPHPTLSESVREAALGFLDGPIHSASRLRDSGN